MTDLKDVMQEKKTDDIFSDLAGGNKRLHAFVGHARAFWQMHANRRTKHIMVIGVIISMIFYLGAMRAPSNFPTNTLVTIATGQDFIAIAESLENQNVVRSSMAMRVLAKVYGAERIIHSGDYLFKEPAGLLDVLKRLSTGAFGLEPVKVQVRDGSTVADIAELLERKMLKFNKEKFLQIASKNEGYLFPDTYYFLPNAPESQIVGAMKDNFFNQYKKVEEAAKDINLSLHEIVTLASLVELEAWKYEDRRKIAGVLYNRLAIDMPLQVDVSFVYIMNKGSFEVTREDMRHQSPYNTYVHKGLPPGPIGSPSLASLKATVDPAGMENNWLFYLADSTGVTHFSKTYAQHLALKRKYIDNR